MSLVLLKRKGKGGQEEQEEAKEQKGQGFAGKVKAWFSGVKERFVSAFEDFKESISSAFDSVLSWFNLGPAVLRKGLSSAGAAFLALGIVGVAVFGYELFQAGGLTALTGMASGVGLILSLVVLIAGIYMK